MSTDKRNKKIIDKHYDDFEFNLRVQSTSDFDADDLDFMNLPIKQKKESLFSIRLNEQLALYNERKPKSEKKMTKTRLGREITLRINQTRKEDNKEIKKTAYTRQTIDKYLSGAIVPSAEVLIAMREIFNVSIDYLLGYSDYVSPEYQSLNEEYGLDKLSADYLFACNQRKNDTTIALINLLIDDMVQVHLKRHNQGEPNKNAYGVLNSLAEYLISEPEQYVTMRNLDFVELSDRVKHLDEYLERYPHEQAKAELRQLADDITSSFKNSKGVRKIQNIGNTATDTARLKNIETKLYRLREDLYRRNAD